MLQIKIEDEPLFHGVILDCECKLKSGEIVDVEIQNALNFGNENVFPNLTKKKKEIQRLKIGGEGMYY